MGDRAARRIVVTGLGLVTPLGTGVEKTWKAVCAGESGIGRITKFDPTGYDAQIAGEVKDFDPAQFIEKKEIKKMDTFIHYAVGAAQLAVDDAGLKVTPDKAARVGVYIGSGIGGLGSILGSIITGFARLDGWPVALLAGDPSRGVGQRLAPVRRVPSGARGGGRAYGPTICRRRTSATSFRKRAAR